MWPMGGGVWPMGGGVWPMGGGVWPMGGGVGGGNQCCVASCIRGIRRVVSEPLLPLGLRRGWSGGGEGEEGLPYLMCRLCFSSTNNEIIGL